MANFALLFCYLAILGAQGDQGIFQRLTRMERTLSHDLVRLKSVIHQHRFPGHIDYGFGVCGLGEGICTGPLKLFYVPMGNTKAYYAPDEDFEKFTTSESQEVKVGVVDNGIYASTDGYLSPHVVPGRDFSVDVLSKAVIPSPGTWLGTDILDKKPSNALTLHGTNVAGQAAWGTPLIKLIDVAMKQSNEAMRTTEEYWVHVMSWAIKEGAKVITSSLIVPFEKPLLQKLLTDNPNVVFVTTTGNARSDFDALPAKNKITPQSNLLLVGGCLKDGGFHTSRGFGSTTVDLFAPSDDLPIYNPNGGCAVLEKAKKLQDEDIAKAKAEAATKGGKWKDFTKGWAKKDDVFVIPCTADVSSDDGVSFAVPVVANVVAKVRILCPKMLASDVAALMRDSSTLDVKGKLAGKARAKMLNPGQAYQLAKDRCV